MKLCLGVIVFIICITISFSFLGAWWLPDGTLISTDDDAGSWGYRIIPDGSGGAVIAWKSSSPYSPYDDRRILAQRVDISGNFYWGSTGIIVAAIEADVEWHEWTSPPIVISAGSGFCVFVWFDGVSIHAQKYDELGNPMWAEPGIIVNSPSSNILYLNAVEDGKEGAIVEWIVDYGGMSSCPAKMQRIDGNGTLSWGADGKYMQWIYDPKSALDVLGLIQDGRGGAIYTFSGMAEGQALIAQRVDSLGTKIWVSAPPDTAGIAAFQAGGRSLRLALAPGNNLYLVGTYEDYSQHDKLFAQKLDSNGSVLWGINGMEVCDAQDDQWEPAIALHEYGGLIVCWRLAGSGLYGQWIHETGGLVWGSSGKYICMGYSPSIFSNQSGGATIAFARSGSSSADIHVQQIDALGNVLWGENGIAACTNDSNQGEPYAIPGDSGRTIIAWKDYRYWILQGDMPDIFALGMEQNGNMVYAGVAAVPGANSLSQNYPNPFNPSTTIRFNLNNPGYATLTIYDVSGRLVRSLMNRYCESGKNISLWDGRDNRGQSVASGIYYYQLTAGAFKDTKKLVLLR